MLFSKVLLVRNSVGVFFPEDIFKSHDDIVTAGYIEKIRLSTAFSDFSDHC